MSYYKVLTVFLLVAAVFAAAPSTNAAPTFTCTFTAGNPATVSYSVAGGTASQVYDVVLKSIAGCATVRPPLTPATIPDLVGVTQTQSFQIDCSTPSSTGYVILDFQQAGNTLSTWVVSYASSASCANLTQQDAKEIPTLSEWAMIIFSVLLLGMMTYYVVRRRRTAQSVAI